MTATEFIDGTETTQSRRERTPILRLAGLVLVLLALVTVTGTFMVLTGLTPIAPTAEVVSTVLAVNGVIVLGLVGVIALEVRKVVIARYSGQAGARLHVRTVALFSFIAAMPAILVAVLASITLDRGLDRWFEQRTRTIVDNAVAVANAYVQEHARVLRGDAIAMATDIDRARQIYDYDPARFDTFMETQVSLRQIPAAYLLHRDGTVVTRTILDLNEKLALPPIAAFAKADAGDPIIIAPGETNQVGVVMKLRAYDDMYLYVTRAMDPRVTDYLRLARDAALEYKALADSRTSVQVAFALVYVGVALVLLLAAIWLGFGFANQLVSPIRRLITAADQVSRGNLNAQVSVLPRDGDLAHLGQTFNTMTTQLRSQRDELLAANDQIDRRRRFTEAVLAGVTAGVLGIDEAGRISLANASARTILGVGDADLANVPIEDILPELSPLIEGARGERARQEQQAQIDIIRNGRQRILSVRVTSDRRRDVTRQGLVVTLDDITDLVAAQRTSAWADVARRIAHEIKNPLTPIQLSAERIRRRYGKRVEDDRAVFDQCVDTIVRQVGDIGRMVDEFSSFARMPKPVFEERDLAEAIREAVFLQSVGHPDVTFATRFDEERLVGRFDSRLIGQAVANVVKNAVEAIIGQPPEKRAETNRIEVSARRDGESFVIDVVDNGPGLPIENRERLLEPYMTTREKGTGLGLAIVGKIVEEHGGRIELLDAPAVATGGRGACIRLIIRAHEPAAGAAASTPPQSREPRDDHGL
ncbi:sensor histidine kinase NtrY-like [Segnochrobactrum spirostomi]|uniref:histidine kinase n=1 Tax=Segnochrobactrum spirostomi TaxID=2608987 RepID=A0A6A7XXS1_9HYPH|nr:PAS domain-containing sensor histidine kinase [Segnochrobactrum spirostomi]MQT11225.1 PAS domain-containing sensor histidine kinase [Segnochrobactrum spirostomi]